MSEILNDKPPMTFWIVGGAALVWNLIGFVVYFTTMKMSPEDMAVFTQAQQNVLNSTPMWATSANAIAVNAGVLGSLLLLLRKAWAVPLFILSFAGILAQDLHFFVLANGLEVWGTDAPIIKIHVAVILIAPALILYARSAKAKGWIS